MKILQAFWFSSGIESNFCVWGEDTDQIHPALQHRRKARKLAQLGHMNAPLHPFMISQDVLKKVLKECLDTGVRSKEYFVWKEIRLPTRGDHPCTSCDARGEVEKESKTPEQLALWKVASICIPKEEVYHFLIKLVKVIQSRFLQMTCGSTLKFWLDLMQGALFWGTRRKIVPAVQEIRGRNQVSFEASWLPLWDNITSKWKQNATQAMPPACFACWTPIEIIKGEETRLALKEYLVETFSHAILTGLVKEIIKEFNKPGNWETCLFDEETDLRYNYRRRDPQKEALAFDWLEDLLLGRNNLSDFSNSSTFVSREVQLLRNLAREVAQYYGQTPIVQRESPLRLCLRLEEPPKEKPDENQWELNFHLQIASQPTIMIPAREIWAITEEILCVSHFTLANPQEFFIKKLAQAGSYYRPINEALETPCPEKILLTTKQAYDFLKTWSDRFEEYDIGVIAPPWWRSQGTDIGAILRITSKDEEKNTVDYDEFSTWFNTESLLTYDWRISIGKEIISGDEFTKLIKKNLPLIRFRDSWVEINPDKQQRILSLLQKKKKGTSEMTLGKALRLGLGQEMLAEGLRVVGLEGTGNLHTLLEKFSSNSPLTPVDVPKTFTGILRPYQERGLSWLAFLRQFQFGACLADDMGLGKTIETITLLLHDKDRWNSAKKTPPPSLLVCPMSIVGNWFHELKRFSSSLKVLIHHGNSRQTGKDFEKTIQSKDIILTTFSLVHRDIDEMLPIYWNYIIVDEAQNIKNHNTKQTQAIKLLRGIHKLALTGTPVENRLTELWSIMDFLNPGYLGGQKEFHTSFERPIAKMQNNDKAGVLKRIIQPFILRRLKTDKTIIQDLPEKVETKVRCNITPEQASIYQGLVDLMMGKIGNAEGIERKGLILATLMKLKQVCDHPNLVLKTGGKLAGRSGKLTRLEEMLEEVIAEGEKALIFTQFVGMGTFLQSYIQERLHVEVLFLHGSTPQPQRDEMVSRFQSPCAQPAVFILSLKAGGVGLNLTAANHVFHYDRWWNPAVENQATDRTYRIGQHKNVLVNKFICVGTLEEHIDEMLEQKRALAENIIGTGETWLTEMSTEQLRSIFTLQQENIIEEE
ncbi:MAG: SNF2 family helicase [Promethearchaeota archaeon CR_4]|nr:MAG: SNF2 family helicase [Candidatus Lokiarchaeota archaeon CR_4]